MPSDHKPLSAQGIAAAREFCEMSEMMGVGNDGTPDRILARYLSRALVDLERARDREFALLKVNGEMAKLWALQESIVQVAERWMDYLDEPEDKPGDGEREVQFESDMKQAIAEYRAYLASAEEAAP